jgi:hypothetical protein
LSVLASRKNVAPLTTEHQRGTAFHRDPQLVFTRLDEVSPAEALQASRIGNAPPSAVGQL